MKRRHHDDNESSLLVGAEMTRCVKTTSEDIECYRLPHVMIAGALVYMIGVADPDRLRLASGLGTLPG